MCEVEQNDVQLVLRCIQEHQLLMIIVLSLAEMQLNSLGSVWKQAAGSGINTLNTDLHRPSLWV